MIDQFLWPQNSHATDENIDQLWSMFSTRLISHNDDTKTGPPDQTI